MISLNHDTHTYTVDGRPFISVTTLLGTWFPKFDADKTIARMNTGRPADEIKAEWEQKGKEAAELGTQLHQSIESYFKGTPNPLDTVEYVYFQEFISKTPLTTFQVEWCLYHEPTTLIGTIDYVSRREDGSLDLYDWKRSSELTKGFGRCLLPELSHIPDSKYWKYTLQLNLYRFLAEENGYKVNKMYIVCFHPVNSGFQKLEVQEIDVKTILNKYRNTTTCG
jgi:hypothetical protein